MGYYDLENLLKRVNGVYKLILLASQRAAELNNGATKLVDARPTEKPTVIALNEILQEKVTIKVTTKNGKGKKK